MRETLFDFASNELYKHVSRLGDRLNHIRDIIGWESFRPILSNLYDNRTEKGGRPNVDEIVMLKVLALQNWDNLSDQEMEYEREQSLVL